VRRAWLSLVAVLLASAAAWASPGPTAGPSTGAGADDAAVFEQGVEAYRAGDLETAQTHWESLLRADAEVDRADVLYDLGNVAWRRGDALQAAARYTACIRLAPRHRDAWYNLEFVRSQAGLEPADRGDLAATGERLLDVLTRDEAAWLALAGVLVFAGSLLFEALRGGALGRRLALAGGLICVVGGLPWAHRWLQPVEAPWFVVQADGAALRSEPREAGAVVGRLDPGTEAWPVDSLPGWERVRTPQGSQGWVAADAVLSLSAEPPASGASIRPAPQPGS